MGIYIYICTYFFGYISWWTVFVWSDGVIYIYNGDMAGYRHLTDSILPFGRPTPNQDISIFHWITLRLGVRQWYKMLWGLGVHNGLFWGLYRFIWGLNVGLHGDCMGLFFGYAATRYGDKGQVVTIIGLSGQPLGYPIILSEVLILWDSSLWDQKSHEISTYGDCTVII